MAVVRFRPPWMRETGALRRDGARGSPAIEAFVVLLVAAALGGLFAVGRDWASPLVEVSPIDLSLAALPRYTLYSLSRGLIAYGLSLVFTIVYGTVAARSR